ncbi:hypothetical protein Pst134EA_029090 [Puccinia striiformis f. sp. tritici]|uniref:hypothetical protein n=1 Tax=Puccinia striiformis f. sp. tritici TaxID=168172 RepID=UPI0020078061|nr:hypothetical protein Pst134EA_029090 [Puccinia striiformis f. sp. tritici]KAH9447103.1 hypothetical protein Pst134EA_029090 [Puccinia striiformis f. sp. tritici]
MVASESISGAATQLIIGALPPSESPTGSNPRAQALTIHSVPDARVCVGWPQPILTRMQPSDPALLAVNSSSILTADCVPGMSAAPKLAKTVIKVKNPAFSLIHSLDLGVSERIATMRDKRARV